MIYVVFIMTAVICAAVYAVIIYNRMTRLTNNISEAWSNILVALERRHTIIGTLADTVKDARKYELLVQASTAAARSRDVSKVGEAEQAIQQYALVTMEQYPAIVSDAVYKELLQQLMSIEDDIQANRLIYNRSVALYIRQLRSFPAGIFAAALGYMPVAFFDVPPAARQVPAISASHGVVSSSSPVA